MEYDDFIVNYTPECELCIWPHVEKATHFCSKCNLPMCEEHRKGIGQSVYCDDCLAQAWDRMKTEVEAA